MAPGRVDDQGLQRALSAEVKGNANVSDLRVLEGEGKFLIICIEP
jgi:hypothetical protein